MKISIDFMTKFFTKDAEHSAFGEPTESVKRLVELLPSRGNVLDLGASDGRHSLYLAEHGFDVTAVDLVPAGLEKIERLAQARGVVVKTEIADASVYSLHNEYEAIVVVLLLQCLNEEASLRLLREMKAHTKPGGVNVVHVFTKSGDRPRLDLEEDPTAFYPADGWLKEFYVDWEIIAHDSTSGPLIGKFREDGSPMTSVVEVVVARKPG